MGSSSKSKKKPAAAAAASTKGEKKQKSSRSTAQAASKVKPKSKPVQKNTIASNKKKPGNKKAPPKRQQPRGKQLAKKKPSPGSTKRGAATRGGKNSTKIAKKAPRKGKKKAVTTKAKSTTTKTKKNTAESLTATKGPPPSAAPTAKSVGRGTNNAPTSTTAAAAVVNKRQRRPATASEISVNTNCHLREGLFCLQRDTSTTAGFPTDSTHSSVLKKLRSRIVTGSGLGHRTSHGLWGCEQAGKTRMLRLLAESLRTIRRLLVLQLEADLYRRDESSAVDAIIQQLKNFLGRRSMPMELRKYYRRFFSSLGLMKDDDGDEDNVDSDDEYAAPAAATTKPARGRNAAARLKGAGVGKGGGGGGGGRKRRRAQDYSVFSSSSSEDDEEEQEEHADRYRHGGVGALANLQAALLKLNEDGIGIVVLVDDIELFALWCDKLTYILAGLMHEVDGTQSGQVGGVSLVMTSQTTSVHMEGRLSSRVTCEWWHLPRLHLTVEGVLRRCLDRAEVELRRRAEESEERKDREEEGSTSAGAVAVLGRKTKQGAPATNDQKRLLLRAPPEFQVIPAEWHAKVVTETSEMYEYSGASPQDVYAAAALYLSTQQAVVVESLAPASGTSQEGATAVPQRKVQGVLLTLADTEYRRVLQLQGGDVFQQLLGSLPLGPKSSASSSSSKPLGHEKTSVPTADEALAYHSLFPGRRSDCSREMFFLLLFVYSNSARGEERSFIDTFQQISGHFRERANHSGEVLNYKRALHELMKLELLAVCRKGYLSLSCSLDRAYQFIRTVLDSQPYYEGCGVGLKELNTARGISMP